MALPTHIRIRSAFYIPSLDTAGMGTIIGAATVAGKADIPFRVAGLT